MSYKDLADTKLGMEGVQSISIEFNEEVSHNFILQQAVEKLAKAGFASRKEIKQEWLTLLKSELGSK